MRLRLLSSAAAILRRSHSVCSLAAVIALTAAPQTQDAKQEQAARLEIRSFAPTSAYSIGTQPLTFVGTIRNAGMSASADDQFTARISALSGLEYTEGDTRPKVPALQPNQSLTFRWKLAPSSADSPLVASLSLESPGHFPDAKVAAVQHFTEPIPVDSPAVPKQPDARAGQSTAVLENSAVRARLFSSDANVPILVVSSHTPTGWKRIGTVLPIASVLSGEGGQRPWWEVFRAESIKASITKDAATLTLTGGFGLRWRGTVILTVRAGSSVVDGRLMLGPLRSLKLSAVRFLPFYAGDGSFGAATTETLDTGPEPAPISAVRWGVITAGCTWLDEATDGGWRATPLESPEGPDYRLLGAEWQTQGPPATLNPGSIVEFRAKVFALSPSAAASDARKVSPPPATTIQAP